jgi:hypothetical protein
MLTKNKVPITDVDTKRMEEIKRKKNLGYVKSFIN